MHSSFVSRAWLSVILLASLAIYLTGLDNTLVFDDRLLTDGRLSDEYGSLLELKPRMLSYGSFVWLQELFGQGWWKQRLINLAVHLAVVVSLWGFYREILRHIVPSEGEQAASGAAPADYRNSPALGLAIGFFAINPAAVYAVAYLVQRSILMATLFVVLALWSFARALGDRKPAWFAVSLACYILAVMSKEHAVAAPLAAVPVYILVARPSAGRLAAMGAVGGLLVALMGVALTIRYGDIIGKPFDEYSKIYLDQLSALGPDVEDNAYALSIINQAYFFFKYGFHWLLPYGGWMSIDLRPPFPVEIMSFPQVLGVVGYIGVIAGGLFLVTRYRDGVALLGLSLLLPAALFITEFSTVWVQDPFVLYRSYLWAIGIPGLVFFLAHGPGPRTVAVIGLVLGVLLAGQAVERILSLATPERVWTDAIEKLPDDPRSVGRWFPYLNRAAVHLDANRLNEAHRDFKASSSLGDGGMGTYNIGAMFAMVGKYPESLAALEDAAKQGYAGFGLDYQRGVALFSMGRFKEAYPAFDAALKKGPPPAMNSRLLAVMGRTALAMGDRAKAITHLAGAIEADPRNGQARMDLGMVYVAGGDYQRAHDLFTTLLKEGPPSGPAYFGRARANYGLKRKAEALSDIDAAIRLGPENPVMQEWRNRIEALPQ